MKAANWLKALAGIPLGLLPLVAGCTPTASNSAPVAVGAAATADPAPAVDGAAADTAVIEPDLEAAAVKPVAASQPVPAELRLTKPSLEIVQLANSGVEESVLLSYVANSPSTFNLTAEQIVYLNDLGFPSAVITAILRHDQELRTSALAAAETPVATETTELVTAPSTPDTATEAIATATTAAVSSTFYDALTPYGTWVEVDGYGLCWQPTVAQVNSEWRPYFDNGHWVYTDAGWYWMSDYTWGWAPFHYGRWFRHQRLGWCWAPGSVWGPAWVTWRYADDYCGWAPLPPTIHFSLEVGLKDRFGRPIPPSANLGLPAECFPFVPLRHFRDRHLPRYAVARGPAERLFHKSTPLTRFEARGHNVFHPGISPDRIAANIRPLKLQPGPAVKPVLGRAERLEPNGQALAVYRPPIAPAKPVPRPPARPPAQIGKPPPAPAVVGPPNRPAGPVNPPAVAGPAPVAVNRRPLTPPGPVGMNVRQPAPSRPAAVAPSPSAPPAARSFSATPARPNSPPPNGFVRQNPRAGLALREPSASPRTPAPQMRSPAPVQRSQPSFRSTAPAPAPRVETRPTAPRYTPAPAPARSFTPPPAPAPRPQPAPAQVRPTPAPSAPASARSANRPPPQPPGNRPGPQPPGKR